MEKSWSSGRVVKKMRGMSPGVWVARKRNDYGFYSVISRNHWLSSELPKSWCGKKISARMRAHLYRASSGCGEAASGITAIWETLKAALQASSSYPPPWDTRRKRGHGPSARGMRFQMFAPYKYIAYYVHCKYVYRGKHRLNCSLSVTCNNLHLDTNLYF